MIYVGLELISAIIYGSLASQPLCFFFFLNLTSRFSKLKKSRKRLAIAIMHVHVVKMCFGVLASHF